MSTDYMPWCFFPDFSKTSPCDNWRESTEYFYAATIGLEQLGIGKVNQRLLSIVTHFIPLTLELSFQYNQDS
jgi:hypothetical protein